MYQKNDFGGTYLEFKELDRRAAGLVVRQDDLKILLDLDRKEEGFQGPLIPLFGQCPASWRTQEITFGALQ